LKKLDVGSNFIGMEGSEAFGEALKLNKALINLELG